MGVNLHMSTGITAGRQLEKLITTLLPLQREALKQGHLEPRTSCPHCPSTGFTCHRHTKPACTLLPPPAPTLGAEPQDSHAATPLLAPSFYIFAFYFETRSY